MPENSHPTPDERQASVERQMADTLGPRDGTESPATESPAREDEVTDEAPDDPKGVGESRGASGEEIADRDGKERGRHDGPTDPTTGRPTGTSDPSDMTGVG